MSERLRVDLDALDACARALQSLTSSLTRVDVKLGDVDVETLGDKRATLALLDLAQRLRNRHAETSLRIEELGVLLRRAAATYRDADESLTRELTSRYAPSFNEEDTGERTSEASERRGLEGV